MSNPNATPNVATSAAVIIAGNAIATWQPIIDAALDKIHANPSFVNAEAQALAAGPAIAAGFPDFADQDIADLTTLLKNTLDGVAERINKKLNYQKMLNMPTPGDAPLATQQPAQLQQSVAPSTVAQPVPVPSLLARAAAALKQR